MLSICIPPIDVLRSDFRSPCVFHRLCTTLSSTPKYCAAFDIQSEQNQFGLNRISKFRGRPPADKSGLKHGCCFTTSTNRQFYEAVEEEAKISDSLHLKEGALTDINVFPTLSDIFYAANERGVKLELKSFGPFFKIRAWTVETNEELGSANGFIKVWLEGKILHLESIKLLKASENVTRLLFGLSLLIGAVIMRYGYDCKCAKAELLAINDDNLTHAKLVRYYIRMGFKPVYEVTGESLKDIPHMLVWGGVGTRMDAHIPHLLRKWSRAFIPR
ncbi:hypothetical protein O6H91_14G030500 [Diphasiastrum complanatum]|uniref:Uncharacterized protein n=1 Tax=Diphasiastrum complanatum TaxID=34168 RepID=A0ACC2BMQ7_DIPCM|nr:hypothetical protein O6H91_14G030500 [Diphasiastrum complanatum]